MREHLASYASTAVSSCIRDIVRSARMTIADSKGMRAMATGYPGSGRMVAHNMVTTQFELDGFRVTRTLGVVRGIVVRSRSIFGTIGAGLQTLVGGNITLLTNLCEKTRADAFDLMLQHAAELGGNAVVGARYDATEVMQGVTEVLAYGTAVFVEAGKLALPIANFQLPMDLQACRWILKSETWQS